MTTEEMAAMVKMLQEISPLGLLSNMEARTIFELLRQRGYIITLRQPPQPPSTEQKD